MKLSYNGKSLCLAEPKIMGILNVTPDSFSDGGRFNHIDTALYHVQAMIAAGADIIDIGGESTRPSAELVPLEEELDRVLPIIERVRKEFDVWLSIDTYKAQVMQEALKLGIDMVNDVKALTEPGALSVVAASSVPVCLMHMQGTPQNMQDQPSYDHLLDEINAFFEQRIDACLQAGIKKKQIILDLGFGFGKTLANNYQLLANLNVFRNMQYPLLVGLSRKSMFHKLLEKPATACDAASLAGGVIALNQGAHILRVHDVAQTYQAVQVMNAIKKHNEE